MTTSYTVFAEDCEHLAFDVGLPREDALAMILDRCGYRHHWERRDGALRLVLFEANPLPRPEALPAHIPWDDKREIASTLVDSHGAHDEIVAEVFGGALKGWCALPDAEFQRLLDDASQRFEHAWAEHEAADGVREARRSHLRLVS